MGERTSDSAGRAPRIIIRFLFIAIVALAFDLVVKDLSFKRVADAPVDVSLYDEQGAAIIPMHEGVGVIPNVFSLRLVLNEGAVFGLGKGGRWVFVLISTIATIVIAFMFARSHRRAWLMHVGLALILSGALGNMYDRMIFGVVRDMCWLLPDVQLPFGWAWPGGNTDVYPWIFNIADAALKIHG